MRPKRIARLWDGKLDFPWLGLLYHKLASGANLVGDAEVGEFLSVFNVEIADAGATESVEVGAGFEVAADVDGEGADVGTGADVSGDVEMWIVIAGDLETVDGDFSGRNVGSLTFSGEAVGALAVDFYGGKDGRGLEDFTGEVGEGGLDLGEGGFGF